MRCTHSTMAFLLLGLAATMVLADVPAVSAQQRRPIAERRQRPGQGFWANQRASRNLQHARDYSQSLYRYSRGVETMEPEVAKSESEELGRKLVATKKEIDAVSKKIGDDKDAQASLKMIGDHLNKAMAKHKELHTECCKEEVDGTVCAMCTSEITKELEKAAAEHAALQRYLELKAQNKDNDK